jgi:ribosomal protein S18 acetylase RimI-like enzyme
MEPVIDIRQMQLVNLTLLHQICCEAYTQNFYHHWEEGGLDNYVDKVFGLETLKAELVNTNIQYYVAFIDEKPVAFMKLNLNSNLPGYTPETGIELDKVYILPEFKGKRIGKKLLDKAFETAQRHNKEIFWLSVIDTNNEAISFYTKIGFQYHSSTRLDYPKFKEELKGMLRMFYKLNAA